MRLMNVEFYLIDAFEIDHFEALYKKIREMGMNAFFVAEPPEINAVGKWFDYDRAIEVLKNRELKYHTECNPDADFACTTQRSDCLRKYGKSTSRVHLTYGVSMLRNIFCVSTESMRGFDFKLVHGMFDYNLCKALDVKNVEIKIVGYPRFWYLKKKSIRKMDLRRTLDINTEKNILLYLPTWDEYSSIKSYASRMRNLKEQYYIVSRPHHCTWRLAEKKRDLELLYEISDMVLPPSYDFCSFANLGDIALVDARSGASMDTAFLNPEMPILLLSTHGNLYNDFHKEIFSLFDVIDKPNVLTIDLVNRILNEKKHTLYRKENMSRFYKEYTEDELQSVLNFFLK